MPLYAVTQHFHTVIEITHHVEAGDEVIAEDMVTEDYSRYEVHRETLPKGDRSIIDVEQID